MRVASLVLTYFQRAKIQRNSLIYKFFEVKIVKGVCFRNLCAVLGMSVEDQLQLTDHLADVGILLLQHLEHLAATILAVIGQKEALDVVELAAFHGAVDLHHGVAAWQSGQIGKRMGVEAVRKTVFEKTGVTLDPEIVYLE